MKLIDEQKRSKLAEGRNYGVGSGFAKIDGDNVITVMPITACKDFLNDFVYTENTNKPYKRHGFHTPYKLGVFNEEKKECYLVFGVLKLGVYLGDYNGYDRDCKTLESNYKNLEKFLNSFEEKFKLENRTEITKLEDNRFLAKVPLFWAKATYRISLYGLLLRVGISYTHGDVMDFLNNIDNNDIYAVKNVIPKIEMMCNGVIPEQDMNNLHDVHNCGIMTFEFPEKKTFN